MGFLLPRPDEVRAINIWSNADLKDGEMLDDTQKASVVGDLKMLARVQDDDKTAEATRRLKLERCYRDFY